MQSYRISTPETSARDWDAWLSYAQDMERHPAVFRDPRHPCGNPECPTLTEALYCCEGCRLAVEGDTPADPEDFYHAGPVTLGHCATADAQHAADQAAGGFAAMVCGVVPNAATPVAPPLPEAPCSANVYLLIQGRQVQLTLRGTDEGDVLARLEAVLALYPMTPGRA